MSVSALSDGLLAKLAGWEVMKHARSLVAGDRVLGSEWQPPVLRGSIRSDAGTLRAGLVIHSDTDAENLCPCRDSRQRGIICAHSVAVGLHFLKGPASGSEPPLSRPESSRPGGPLTPTRSARKRLRRGSAEQDSELLGLCIIFPPNFAEAVARAKVMLYLEGQRGERRYPLNALPVDQPFALDSRDVAVLDALESLNEGETPAMLLLSPAQLADLLPKLAGHSRLTLGKARELQVSSDPDRLMLRATLEANGEIVLQLATKRDSPTTLIRGQTSWSFSPPATLRPIGLPAMTQQVLEGPLRIARRRVPEFLHLEWPAILSSCDVETNFDLADFVMEPAKPDFKLHLAGGLAMLEAKMACEYEGVPVDLRTANSAAPAATNPNPTLIKGAASDTESLCLPDPEVPTRYRLRDFSAECRALEWLGRCGFAGPDSQGRWRLQGQDRVLNFFAREFPRMEKEWNVTLEERLERSTEKNFERVQARFEITPSGEQWFDLHMQYQTTQGERFAPADIQRLLLSGQSHTRSKSGKFALLDTTAVQELQEVLVDCAPRQESGAYRMQQSQAGFLEATVRGQPGWRLQAPESWARQAAQQRGELKLETPPLGPLDPVLRPYQKEGVAWLNFLRAHGFGGVLADEMGLGKTLQVLALLNSVLSERVPSLVVCPTSLVFNWADEAAKFTPALRRLMLQGPDRDELFAKIPEHDLVITSYALLRRDAERYAHVEFDTVILDEAQHIKNRQTQSAQAVKGLRARRRLVLTGTPLENSVLDLWSIFDFLMPGYLGTAQEFRDRYEQPIVRERNTAVQARLGRRLRPFVLRRLKQDVAAELPEKIEQVSFCELTAGQRALYQQVLEVSRHEILAAADGSSNGKSRMLALTALLRLRQICCDPRLLKLALPQRDAPGKEGRAGGASLSPAPGNHEPEERRPVESFAQPEAGSPITSGKVELFGELLEEVLDGGHRVLVFSQFTSMLALLREQLDAQKIEYCYLDGATSDRAGVVQRFQRDSAIPVFLISLKAGGVGLNLSGADTVIHFDPWWNPAVEAQATDRAHRIGQTRVVTSYKLIARGTVEEKILHLQTRKRSLLEGLLGDDEQAVQSLTWEEIKELLA